MTDLEKTLMAFALTGLMTCTLFLAGVILREVWHIVKTRRQFSRNINRYIIGGK